MGWASPTGFVLAWIYKLGLFNIWAGLKLRDRKHIAQSSQNKESLEVSNNIPNIG